MPRGNDTKAALSELADKFGKGVGNAEELIDSTLEMRSPALRRAELLPIDVVASSKLDLSKLKGPDGEKVVSAKVRGGSTVIVYEDDRGAYRLAVLDDDGKVAVAPKPEPPVNGPTDAEKAEAEARIAAKEAAAQAPSPDQSK